MELPNYRLPSARNVCQLLWEKAKDFLERAFTVIFVATIVIWFLQTFDFGLNMVADSADSMLAVVAGWIAPAFAPLGFGDWRISTALVTGFMAKESVVSTLSILFGSTASLVAALSAVAALALLVFCLLYTPCVAAVASVRRELGGKWALGVVFGQLAVAWVAAFAVHGAGTLLVAAGESAWTYAVGALLAGLVVLALARMRARRRVQRVQRVRAARRARAATVARPRCRRRRPGRRRVRGTGAPAGALGCKRAVAGSTRRSEPLLFSPLSEVLPSFSLNC